MQGFYANWMCHVACVRQAVLNLHADLLGSRFKLTAGRHMVVIHNTVATLIATRRERGLTLERVRVTVRARSI